jgi:hypothetical protein
VSFSGGGGSGAAAYATVGSGTTFKSVGGISDFSTPSGIGVRIVDAAGTTSQFLRVRSTVSGSTGMVVGSASVSEADVSLIVASQGAGAIRFNTARLLDGTQGADQMRVAHTTSAVNYVQVTGAVTGAAPVISAQGSDTNIGFTFNGKGTGSHTFQTNGTTRFLVNSGGTVSLGYTNGNPCLTATGQTSQVNGLQVTGAAAGAAPVLASIGSDTNIDLTLTPKGTGNVRFGTRTASADAAITGYIEIKDSGGTTRRLAVIG